ncbi:MAG: hypothetical protein AB2A00_39030 [Myxococcota bacterium]
MRRHLVSRLLPLVATLAVGAVRGAEDGPYKATPEYEALARDYRITKVLDVDLDGDVLKETLLAFRDRQDDGNTAGGILVLKQKGGVLRNAGCVLLEDTYPADVGVQGKELNLQLARGDRAADDLRPLTLTLGKELGLRGDAGDPFGGIKLKASSTVRTDNADVKNVYDQDITTSWAEGASGTGIGESLTFEFPKPVGVGLMAVYPGKGTGQRDFRDFNRIHRAVLEVSTQSTTGDTSANLDFADLGIDLAGNKTEVSFANKPEMRFIKVAEPEVVKMVLRVDSVYLGDRKDDTHVAEVAFCSLLSSGEIQELSRKQQKKKG